MKRDEARAPERKITAAATRFPEPDIVVVPATELVHVPPGVIPDRDLLHGHRVDQETNRHARAAFLQCLHEAFDLPDYFHAIVEQVPR